MCSGKTSECVADDMSSVLGVIQTDFSILCSVDPRQCSSDWLLLTNDGQQAAPYGPR